MNIEDRAVELLIKAGYHISFAESCTAGLAAGKLVNVPDASKVLDVSFITYANEAKIKYLGVEEETIKAHGVVSEEVAREMALGVSREAGAEVGVGITGIAGPSGGVPGKPVGTVCFGFFLNEKVTTVTLHFEGGRNVVRSEAAGFALTKMYEIIRSAYGE